MIDRKSKTWKHYLACALVLIASCYDLLFVEHKAKQQGPLAIVGLVLSVASIGLQYVAAKLAPKPPNTQLNRADPQLQTSEYGKMLPRLYGEFLFPGQIIWQSFPFKDTVTTIPGQRRKGKRATPDADQHSYSCSLAIKFGGGPYSASMPWSGLTELWFDTTLVYVGAIPAGDNSLGYTITGIQGVGSCKVYVGSMTQDADPTMQAVLGMGNVSAHRGWAYIVLTDLVVDKWGNRIPNVRARWKSADSVTVADVITAECAEVGLDSSFLNVSAVDDPIEHEVLGYLINNRQSARANIEPLMQAYQFDMGEWDGKLNAVPRPQEPVVTIPIEDLGTVEEQEKPTPRTEALRRQDLEIPRGWDVVYTDSLRNYEQGMQSYRRQTYAQADAETLNLPSLALTPVRANRLARILTVTGQTERVPITFTLQPKYMYLTPSDVVSITTSEGKQMDVRVEKIEGSVGSKLTVIAVQQIAEAYDQVGVGDSGVFYIGPGGTGPGGGGGFKLPCDTDVMLLQNSEFPLSDQYADQNGYWAAGTCGNPNDQTKEWQGSVLYQDTDGAGDLRPVATLAIAATKGTAITALASATGLDTVNTVNVELTYGSLESITDGTFTATETENMYILGEEVVQVRDVTPLGNNQYTLSHMKRGLRGTEGKVGTHGVGEQFAVFNNAFRFIPVEEGDLGTFDFAAVTVNQDIEDVVPGSPGYREGFEIS